MTPTTPPGLVLHVGGAGVPFGDAFGAFRAFLDAQGVEERARYTCALAFEELATNVLRHAGIADAPGEATVVVTAHVDADRVRLRFEDRGPPFDPTRHAERPEPGSIDEMPIGGLGIRLVRRSVDGFAYARTPLGNRVDVEIARR